MNGSDQTDRLLESPASAFYPTVPPDGRFVAYASLEAGGSEVFIRPFDDMASARWQVSQDGGSHPNWSRRGGEVFFLDRARRVVAARVEI